MTKKKIPVVTIDTGVPIPGKIRYPLEQLKVGESFVFPVGKRNSVQARASRYAKESGRKFEVRRMDQENCRVWRVA